MKLKCFSIGTLGLLALSGLAWSCSSKSEDCNANLNCGPYGGGTPGTGGASGGAAGASGKGGAGGASSSSGSGSGGEGGTDLAAAGSGGAPPPTCDGSLSPDTDACVISDEYGIFVSPDGDDSTADGKQAHPYATLTSALAGIQEIKHVYVCAADYVEPATLEIPDRVSIYGGFSCDGGTWKYDSPYPAHLLPASPIGAMITGAKVGVVIQDLRIDAADAPEDGTGASSFGMMVSGSKNIALKRVEIRAGKGGKGNAGADGATGLDGIPSAAEQDGAAATCSNPPASRVGPQSVAKICGSQGGAGGSASVGTAYSAALDGGGAYLVSPPNGGKGGQVFGNSATRGQDGDKGLLGELGAAAPAMGTFSAAGYLVASGGNGGPGKPGAGGGGGGASLGSATCLGATGGAGGMGGCGGDPGSGGVGGGASVALFSWQSSLTLDRCVLAANIGGAGGNGGTAHAGGAGKAGGTGGSADAGGTVGVGGDGGKGGNGGNGGNGAGGTGGPSIALVYDGTPPMQLGASTLSFASVAAAAGKGGTLGLSTNYGPDGTKGLTQEIYPKP